MTPRKELVPRYRPGFWGALSERERLEIAIGAILTQNTNWGNVCLALERLNLAQVLELEKLSKIKAQKLQSLIRSSGYFRQKSRKIKIFVEAVLNRGGSLKNWLSGPLEKTRKELLSLWGIGPETADSILLYVSQRPIFVVDAYTLRISRRLGWVHETSYDKLQKFFESHLPKKSSLYSEFHALFVALAKNYCRTKPICRGCPVSDICAHGVQVLRK